MRRLRKFLDKQVQNAWYGDANWTALLRPLEPLYAHAATKAQVQGQMAAKSAELDVPVIVVGNITVGGTGKSPVVVRLARELKNLGYHPGILSRGYKGNSELMPRLVLAQDLADDVGDEPLMMVTQLGDIPVVVDRDRLRGAQFLKAQGRVDVVICDDGLQHYNLPRDIEILVIDAERGLGNGHLLPVGPLRESADRLDRVDFVICNGAVSLLSAELADKVDFEFKLGAVGWLQLASGKSVNLPEGPTTGPVMAISGIGNPERFHRSLEDLGLEPIPRVFPDHHRFVPADFSGLNEASKIPLVMTLKDAVKCHSFATENWWALEIEAELPSGLIEAIAVKLDRCKGQREDK